jgi:hypothetical protein
MLTTCRGCQGCGREEGEGGYEENVGGVEEAVDVKGRCSHDLDLGAAEVKGLYDMCIDFRRSIFSYKLGYICFSPINNNPNNATFDCNISSNFDLYVATC